MEAHVDTEALERLIGKVTRVAAYAAPLVELQEKALRSSGRSYLEVEEWLQKALVGGTKPPGERPEDSLSALTRVFLGVEVDLEEYYIYLRQGLKPDVQVRREYTVSLPYYYYGGPISRIPYMTMVLYRIALKLLELARVAGLYAGQPKSEVSVESIVEDPQRLGELIEAFLEACRDLSVGVDAVSTFVFSVRKVTRRYAVGLYPNLAERLDEIGEILGLEELFVPKVADEEFRRSYTILGYPDYAYEYYVDYHGRRREQESHMLGVADPRLCASSNGRCEWCIQGSYHIRTKCFENVRTIGGALCKLNDAVWVVFREASRHLKFIPDVGREYLRECRARCSIPRFLSQSAKRFGVRGAVVYGERLKMGLSEFLNELMPITCLGLYELVVGEDHFYVIPRWW